MPPFHKCNHINVTEKKWGHVVITTEYLALHYWC